MVVKLYFIVVLICIFLMMNDIKPLFTCLLPSIYLFGEIVIKVISLSFNQVACLTSYKNTLHIYIQIVH